MMSEKKWWRDFGVGQKIVSVLSENKDKEMIVFDTETTGLSPDTNHVIQLSAIKCVIDDNCQFHEIGRLDTYINPGYTLPKKIVQITGITDEKLAKFPDEMTQWPVIYDFFGDSPIVCGHNVPFDISMLKAMYRRYDKEFTPTDLDTLRMAQELHRKDEAGSHKLGVLAEHFGLDYGLTFHNSMDDVIATMRLLRLFVEEYLEKKANENVEFHTFDSEGNDITVSVPKNTKMKTKIKSCWTWVSKWNDPKGGGPMRRLYVRVKHEDRVLWMNQKRPYDWGEKDKGSIDLFDIQDIEQQVMQLYCCETLEELSKVRESKYAK
jgi:DNA polymerase-3 subunit alpha (Gram-positive type)